ncbi:hypothetical protein H4R34_003364 [Dimargaris verticillata]|uniref:Translin n=1 Tax=Dimargaris verticillata TaxID=2761393 RepID=A0A9W8B4P9_9FUNG|nr:hypothetical protein H4R34_003364 [Dimargaris verticillata]
MANDPAATAVPSTLFPQLRDLLDTHYDRRERVIRHSRDITQQSKKLIFHLLRYNPQATDGNAKLFAEADQKHAQLQQCFDKLRLELNASNRYRYGQTATSGIQEYIEALALWKFLQMGVLVSLAEVEARLNGANSHAPLHITSEDYLLGLSDVTGELMRHCINSLARGNRNEAEKICDFMRAFYNEFALFSRRAHPQLSKKLIVMEQSLAKVENACYRLRLQVSEFPDNTRMPALDFDTAPAVSTDT